MFRRTSAPAFAAAAVLSLASAAHAQTYVVEPGTLYTASAVSSSVFASQMSGTLVTVRFSDGSASGGTWGFLFSSMGTDYYGVSDEASGVTPQEKQSIRVVQVIYLLDRLARLYGEGYTRANEMVEMYEQLLAGLEMPARAREAALV